MSIKYAVGEDPYCINGTLVLKNKFGITDEQELAEEEIKASLISAERISYKTPPYNLEYLKEIHLNLFNDVYPWAGELRTIGICKGETVFCIPERIQPESEKTFKELFELDFFLGSEKPELAENIAKYYTDINMIHPFREGNGRAQRILFEHIALHNGYIIDWGKVSKEDWISANIDGVNCDYRKMQNIFRKILIKLPEPHQY